MGTSIIRRFTGIRQLLNLTFATLFIFSSAQLYLSTDRARKISALNEGIGTCFSRAKQSLTAKLIGDSLSEYLGSSFMATTEECFAEAMAVGNKEIGKGAKEVTRKLNKATTELRWFHETLSMKELDQATKDAPVSGVSQKFEKVEVLVLDSLDELRDYAEITAKEANSSKYLFYALAIIFPLMLILEFTATRKRTVVNNHIEKEASIELSSIDSPASARVEELVNRAFKNNGLFYLSDLFARYHGDVLEGKLNIVKRNISTPVATEKLSYVTPEKIVVEPVVEATNAQAQHANEIADLIPSIDARKIEEMLSGAMVAAPKRETALIEELNRSPESLFFAEEAALEAIAPTTNQIERTEREIKLEGAKDAEVEVLADHQKVNLDQVFGGVIDLISEKLFTHGIALEIDIPTDLEIASKTEELEQVIFNLMINSINCCSHVNEARKINVTGTTVGASVILTITDNGVGFDEAVIHGDEENLDATLLIAKELAKEVGASISFENIYVSRNQVGGALVKLFFRGYTRPMAQKSRVVMVKKGKKKDIAKEIRGNV